MPHPRSRLDGRVPREPRAHALEPAAGAARSAGGRRGAGPAIYLDTSFLIPYYLAEGSSEGVEDVLRAAEPGTLRVSDLTVVEFAGALARLERLGHLVGDVRRVQQALEAHLGRGLDRLAVTAHHFDVAAELLLQRPALGLRTNDALHLAVTADPGEVLMTLDRRLLHAARTLGLDATDAGLFGDRA